MAGANQITQGNQNIGEAVQSLIQSNLSRLNTSFLALVKEVDTESNRVTIEPIAKKEGEEDFTIPDVLVGYPSCKDMKVSLKLQEGDCGIAIVSDRDITRYKEEKIAGVAPSNRTHFLGDSVFIPLSLVDSVLEKSSTEFAEYTLKSSETFSVISGKMMEFQSDDEIKITSTKDLSLVGSKVEIKGQGGTLFEVLDTVITTLISAKTIPAAQGSPLTFDPMIITDLTKAKTTLSMVLK